MAGDTIPLGPIDLHYGGKPTDTVKVKADNYYGFALIDAKDFDPVKHTIFQDGGKAHGEGSTSKSSSAGICASENIWPDIEVPSVVSGPSVAAADGNDAVHSADGRQRSSRYAGRGTGGNG
jgi:hypothetical protein